MSDKPTLKIVVEEDAGAFAAGSGDKVLCEAADAFEDLGEMLSDASKKFLDKINENKPSKIELALGLKLEVGGNWLVVTGKGTANTTVTLTWE